MAAQSVSPHSTFLVGSGKSTVETGVGVGEVETAVGFKVGNGLFLDAGAAGEFFPLVVNDQGTPPLS